MFSIFRRLAFCGITSQEWMFSFLRAFLSTLRNWSFPIWVDSTLVIEGRRTKSGVNFVLCCIMVVVWIQCLFPFLFRCIKYEKAVYITTSWQRVVVAGEKAKPEWAWFSFGAKKSCLPRGRKAIVERNLQGCCFSVCKWHSSTEGELAIGHVGKWKYFLMCWKQSVNVCLYFVFIHGNGHGNLSQKFVYLKKFFNVREKCSLNLCVGWKERGKKYWFGGVLVC
jgi:hypothetical protein